MLELLVDDYNEMIVQRNSENLYNYIPKEFITQATKYMTLSLPPLFLLTVYWGKPERAPH